MKTKKAKTYLEERLEDQKFREGFESEYLYALISERLAKIRHQADLTQERLAKKMHTKKSVISRYESGKYHGYSITALEKFARACGRGLEIRFTAPEKHRKLQTI